MPLFGKPKMKKLRDKKDVKGLIKALRYKKNWVIRLQAANLLSDLGDPQAVEPLMDALNDEKRLVREAAQKALLKLGWQPEEGDAPAFYWISTRRWDKCVEMGAPAVEPLIEALENEKQKAQSEAAWALGKIGAPAVEPLIKALRIHYKWEVRMYAARSLGQISDVRTVEPLISALSDRRRDVREAAATSLVWLYKKGEFDQEVNKTIFAQHLKILGMQRGRVSAHHDRPGCFGGHHDFRRTTDRGFHADFSR